MPNPFPALPPRPAANATSTTVFVGSSTPTIAPGQVISVLSLDIPGATPATYYNPSRGSPAVIASHEFAYDWTLTNNGTIWNESTLYSATGANVDGLNNRGLIVAHVAIPPATDGSSVIYGAAYGVLIYGHNATANVAPALVNSGSIFAVSEGGISIGVYTDSVRQSFTNSGLIAAQASYGPDHSQSGGAQGIRLNNGGYLDNQAGGQIIAEGAALAYAVYLGRGEHPAFDFGPSVRNEGLIQATVTDPDGRAIGIYAVNIGTEHLSIENSGTIRATIAIYAPSDPLGTFTSALQVNPQTVTNLTSGVIEGDILLFGGNDTLINHGTITGHVDLGADNDLFDNTGGTLNGSADLGFGADHFIGSNNADAVEGNMGNDLIEGNGGNDLLLGGNGDDVIIGGTGNDGLYGETGNDRIVTLGGDLASGGIGNDRIETGDYAFASIDGGSGVDTWVLDSGTRSLDLALVVASGRVTGIEQIALGGHNTLVVHPGDIAGLSGGSALYITGASTDTVYLSGSWTAGATSVVGGISYVAYSSGVSTVYAQVGASVTVGNAPPPAGGLDAVAGGGVAPLPGSVAGAVLTGPAIEVQAFELTSSLLIGRDEIWYSSHGGTVLTANDLNAELINYGTILSSNPSGLAGALGSAYGALLYVYGNGANFGTIQAETVGSGSAIGISSGHRGVLSNDGNIYAFAVNGDAYAVQSFAGGLPGGGYSTVNRGDIYAQSDNGFATGFFGRNFDSLRNDSIVEAYGGNGAIAVDLSVAGGSVLNNGSITANVGDNSAYYAIGIAFFGRASLINTGTISAEIAVYSYARYAENLEITNSGSITGDILYVLDPVNPYGRLLLTNSGDIYGNIIASDGLLANNIVNTGYIGGSIALGADNDVYDGRGGELAGLIYAGAGADTIYGDIGNDRLFGEVGDDLLSGGLGNDLLVGGLGADQLIGGAGTDTASYADDIGGIFVNLTTGFGYGGTAQGDTYVGIENIVGTVFDDFIIGDNNANRLEGLGGNDIFIGSLGADVFDGGSGNDTVSYIDNQGPIFINLTSGLGYNNAAQGDSFISIENITGGIYNDFIIGNAVGNVIDGGAGDDYIIGALGPDTIIGGSGIDTASYEDNQGPIFINLTTGRGYGNAAEGDTLSGIENVVGELYDDFIIGDANANRIEGRYGNDTLIGADGADTFVFNTTLSGGGNVDTITDFAHGSDHIELSRSIFTALGLGTLTDANFALGAATTVDQHILYDAATGNLSYDADGSGAGAAIVFANLSSHPTTITSADFVITP